MAALLRCSVLNSPPDPYFDAITRVAAHALGTPMAAITFVAGDYTCFKSCHGLTITKLPRHTSLCDRVIAASAPLIIHDAREHPVLASSPLVTGPTAVRFYASVPLFIAREYPIGTLAVLDPAPRHQFDPQPLHDLAALLEHELNRRHTASQPHPDAKLLHDLADALPAIIWTSDPHGRSTFATNYWHEFSGIDPHGGGDWIDAIHPDDRARILALIAKCKRSHSEMLFECRFRRADGEYRWMFSNARPAFDDYGNFTGHVGICLDIGKRKNAESALRDAEQRYQNLFETMKQGVLHFSASGHILSMNPAGEQILGIDARQLVGRHFSEAGLPDLTKDGAPLATHHLPSRTALRTAKEIRDFVLQSRNARTGRPLWLSVDAFPQFRPGESKPSEVLSVFQDITARVEAESAAAAIEDRFRRLVEHGLEIIGILDSNGVIRYLSPAAERILGYPPGAITGTNAADYLHPDDVPRFVDDLATLSQQPGRTIARELRIRHLNGSCRFMQTAATNATHIPALNGIAFNAHDVTDQKRFERELIESRDQLRQLAAHVESAREQERARIARGIHDELGQMLSALKLDIEGVALAFPPPNPAHRSKFLARIRNITRNIETTIHSVRRICAELRPSLLDHLGIAAALKSQIAEFQSRTGIRCRCTGLNNDIRLGAEQSTAVFRICQEILTNITRHASATTTRITVSTNAGRFSLRVSDNGRGVQPETVSDPHSLGLLGMRERALAVGGALTIVRRRGGGTMVELRIPAHPGAPTAAAPQTGVKSVRHEPPVSPRILLVDDHSTFRHQIRDLLAAAYPTAVLTDMNTGAGIHDAIRTINWDLLVLDVSMPGISGIDILDSLTQSVQPPPVLILSMEANSTYCARVRARGAAGCIGKSSSPAQIVAAIRDILAGIPHFRSDTL